MVLPPALIFIKVQCNGQSSQITILLSGPPLSNFTLLSFLHITIIILDYISMDFSPYNDRYISCCRVWLVDFGITVGCFYTCLNIFYTILLIFSKTSLFNHYYLVRKIYMYSRFLYFTRPHKINKVSQSKYGSQAAAAILCNVF